MGMGFPVMQAYVNETPGRWSVDLKHEAYHADLEKYSFDTKFEGKQARYIAIRICSFE